MAGNGPALEHDFGHIARYGISDIAYDPQGRLHIYDDWVIRRLDPDTGRLEIVVGRPEYGPQNSGDGGPATEAHISRSVVDFQFGAFSSFRGMTFAPNGDLYLASDRRIRRVRATDGIIETVAGTGRTSSNRDGTSGIDARLGQIWELEVDAEGNIYFAEDFTKIRRIRAQDGRLETVVEGGSSFQTLALDSDGRLYFTAADLAGFRTAILRVDGPPWQPTLVAGGFGPGPRQDGTRGIFSPLEGPGGLSFDREDNLYFVDGGPTSSSGHALVKIDSQGILSVLAPLPTPPPTIVSDPSGNLVSFKRTSVRRFVEGNDTDPILAGQPDNFVDNPNFAPAVGDGGPADQAVLLSPYGIAIGRDDSVYVVDNRTRLRRIDSSGTISTVAGGEEDGLRFDWLIDVAVAADGSIFTADRNKGQVRKISPDGLVSTIVDIDGFVSNVALDSAGNVFYRAINPANFLDRVVAGSGRTERLFGFTNTNPAVDPFGRVYFGTLSDVPGFFGGGPADELLQRLDPETRAVETILNLGQVQFGGLSLSSLTVDPTGKVYLALQSDIKRLDPETGETVTVATGVSAARIALDSRNNLYATDENKHAVMRINLGPPDRRPLITRDGIVQAASLEAGALAPNTWASLFGLQLANETTIGDATPLPTELGGVSVTLTDSQGTAQQCPLQFVSKTQINFLVPPGVALGPARIHVENAGGVSAERPVEIAAVAPGLFSMNSDGQGVAAAFAFRVGRDGNQTAVPIFRFDTDAGRFTFQPTVINPAVDELFLLLFGTGIRGRSRRSAVTASVGGVEVPVLFAGPQEEFAGLDQVNVGPIPESLKDTPGETDIVLTVDGVQANVVQVGLF